MISTVLYCIEVRMVLFRFFLSRISKCCNFLELTPSSQYFEGGASLDNFVVFLFIEPTPENPSTADRNTIWSVFNEFKFLKHKVVKVIQPPKNE